MFVQPTPSNQLTREQLERGGGGHALATDCTHHGSDSLANKQRWSVWLFCNHNVTTEEQNRTTGD